jgi:hypothetical protein
MLHCEMAIYEKSMARFYDAQGLIREEKTRMLHIV